MTDNPAVPRRHMLAASLGATAAGALASCAAPSEPAPRSPRVTDAPAARNVRDFGAVGDGHADDTEALARAAAPGDGPLVLYLPAGHYLVTSWPQLPDYTAVLGDGGDATTIVYEGDGTLIALTRRQRVRFARMGIFTSGPRSTAVALSECFRCSFESVVLRGNHQSENHPRYAEQRGVVLDRNTGGTTFIDCDINNFGYGVVTSCIQNYVTASKFADNRIGVLGTGGDHNAGLSLTNVEFVADKDPRTTDRHVVVDGAANDWWFTNVWFEGAETALSVGAAGQGGPAQFGMVNCKVAARAVCLDLVYCRQPYLANVEFDADDDTPPVELRVDAAGCPEGTAVNLISGTREDIDPAVFPVGWNVIGRGTGARFSTTVVAQAGEGDGDLFQARNPQRQVLAAVLPSGAWLSERTDGGIVLKDEQGTYWRLSVGTDGAVTTASLGIQRPRR
ncbi:mannuronan epimerase [Nocardia cyriacigeorgica]|uniref:Mannuronan epimerase n=1 Tax=Nocardia cyriacigeorgica TaxID=135487 RepID=A0A5R8PB68_9NOCA|nr:glycosyl hydrolase family 28-related protein [Nocardia cyriacigeorgica]TLG05318.1 mannuronan epimerase [Nocardia cyriacigeorgica]